MPKTVREDNLLTARKFKEQLNCLLLRLLYVIFAVYLAIWFDGFIILALMINILLLALTARIGGHEAEFWNGGILSLFFLENSEFFLTFRGNEEFFKSFYLECGIFCFKKLMRNCLDVNFFVFCQIALGNVEFLSSKISPHPPKL